MTSRIPTVIAVSVLLAGAANAAEPAPKTAARTLDAITIEGAVDVPQVLFITSRDNARFDDGLGWSFLPRPAEVLAAAARPTVVRPYVFEKDLVFEKDFKATDHPVPVQPASPAAKE